MVSSASATALKLSARLSSRQLRRTTASACAPRSFSSSRAAWAAQNFTMPAMSPTMTEGSIASWKVKEGDSFAAGDVLLEIETDKAQMDVEAQEDGKLAKIMVQDGSKGVKVGKRIAVLAEETDDLDSLELPQEDSEAKAPTSKKSVEPAQETSATKEPPQKSKPSSETAPTKSKKGDTKAEDRSATKPSSSKSQTQKYPLYPSVQMLLHSNGLSSSEANKIPATGPNGRLLKGDVLAHLGRLSQKNYAGEQSERIKELGHLDLSNIKKAIPKQAAKKEEAKKAPAEKIEEPDTQVTVPISLVAVLATQKRIQDSLGLHLPLSTFIARASELANEDLPRGRSAPATSEELFDAVLGLDKIKTRTSRGNYVPQITVLSPSSGSADVTAVAGPRKKMDIIDLLSGNKALGAKPREAASSGATGAALTAANNAFSVSVKKGDEKRARVYLERIKTVLEMEPGQLVL